MGPLAAAGYRVAAMDLRGHGESSATFTQCDGESVASDILATIAQLKEGPAVVVGNSLGAAAAVLASAKRPGDVAGLALIGPFVRDHGNAAPAAGGAVGPGGVADVPFRALREGGPSGSW